MGRLVGLFSLGLALAATGCRNQSAGTFSNPFMTPDRVPPPSTRVLTPGTAQPYYPGDPVPGAATSMPTFGPGATIPGGTVAPPGTTPPGGWGSFPPQSSAAPGDAISIPADQGSLHYAAAEFPTAPPVAAPLAAAPPADALLPIQSLLPMSSGPTPQQLAQREVQPAEYLYSAPESGATLASAQAPRDGFRPQGSQPLRDDAPTSPSRAPLPGRDAAASTFAADAQYQWLRGQLEYWPASGHWSLRYAGEGAPPDELGGRVLIDNPQVLANLSPGELVAVQGQLFTRTTELGAPASFYRVSAVQRQRQ